MSQIKKAERSRVHAKQRRTQEAKEISEIAEQLPLSLEVTRRLDKGAILRLALTYLRLKHLVGDDVTAGDGLSSAVNEGNLMLDSLNGFFIIISTNGDIIFVSSNVEAHTGLSEVELLGKDINEFILEKDQKELKKQFTAKYSVGESVQGMALSASGNHIESDIEFTLPGAQEHHRQFFLRMKCSYLKRTGVARSQPLSSMQQSDYLLLQWTGSVHFDQEGNVSFLAAVVRPLQPTPIMELKMDGNMFISRHSLDLYFMYCDPRLATMLGYEPNEIPGSSMYQYHHPGDLEMCGKCHSNLMTAGTSISKYYRFLSKNDEWCWLQTRATIVYNTTKQPQYIVCMNYIVSEKEGRRYLMEYFNKSDNSLAPMPSSLSSALVGSLVNPLSDVCLESDSAAEPPKFDAMSDSVSTNVQRGKQPSASAAYQPTNISQMQRQHVDNSALLNMEQQLGVADHGAQRSQIPSISGNQQYGTNVISAQQQSNLHESQLPQASVHMQQGYPASSISHVRQHPHGVTPQYPGSSPTHLQQASHSPAGVPQHYPGNSPTHLQQASHSPAGVPQHYPGNSPTHLQQTSHSPAGVPQHYPVNSPTHLQQASHSPAGVPQHYPGNSPTHRQQASHSPAGVPQNYPGNSPTHLQQASHSPAGVPQQYPGNSPTHIQQASHSPAGVPQQYPGNSPAPLQQTAHSPAGLSQQYPGNSPTHSPQTSHSSARIPQRYSGNNPTQLQPREPQLPLGEQISIPTTFGAAETSPAPTTSHGQTTPLFYLPHQMEQQEAATAPTVSSAAVGEAWISVHLVADPTIHTQPEMMSGSLASEMEDISFDHCRQLMNRSTQNVLDMYTDQQVETSERDEQDWSKCASIADGQARAMAHNLMTGSGDNLVRSALPGQRIAGESSAPLSMDSHSSRSSSSTGSSNTMERQPLGKPASGGFVIESQPTPTLAPGYMKAEMDMSEHQFVAPDVTQRAGGVSAQLSSPVYNDVMFPPAEVNTGAPTLSIPAMPATRLARSAHSSMSLSSDPSFTSPDELFRQSTQSLMSLSSDVSINSLLPTSADIDFTHFPPTTDSYAMPSSDNKQFEW